MNQRFTVAAVGAAITLSSLVLAPTDAFAQVMNPPPNASAQPPAGDPTADPAAAEETRPVDAPPPVVVVAPAPDVIEIQTPPPPPRLHDFLDTRLTWTFGDDDVLQPTGYRVPNSPLPSIGDRQQYQLFFDALNSRYAGRENLTHLTMYSRAPGFIPHVVTEAALVVRLDLTQLTTGNATLNQALYDAGTYIRLQYQTNMARPNDGFSFTFFPFDTDRFRLGYLWDLSWGGNDIFPRRVGGAPGLRVGFDSGPFTSYLGFKTAGIVVPLQVVTQSADIEVVRVQETQYAVLGGVGYRFSDMARIDAGAGYFQQGRFDFPGVRGQQAYLYGASARFVLNKNLAPATSIDMMLYRNHPDYPMALFAPEIYHPGEVSWLLSLEVNVINQHLADIDHPGATADQLGLAGALQGRIKVGYLGLGLTGLYRDVPYLLRNVPSFIPFQTIPNDPTVHVTPEYFVAASIDYRIASANLLPSLIVGVQLPATFSTQVTEGALESQRTLVIRSAGNFSILPPGNGAVPIVSTRLAMRWDLSSIFAIIGWVQYVRDNNGTLLSVDQSGTRQIRYFQAPDQLGFGLTAQARY